VKRGELRGADRREDFLAMSRRGGKSSGGKDNRAAFFQAVRQEKLPAISWSLNHGESILPPRIESEKSRVLLRHHLTKTHFDMNVLQEDSHVTVQKMMMVALLFRSLHYPIKLKACSVCSMLSGGSGIMQW
jgi:hypothetical protein